jgi:hypothetical protein
MNKLAWIQKDLSLVSCKLKAAQTHFSLAKNSREQDFLHHTPFLAN